MPTSHWQQLNEITEMIILADPRRLLDVGAGSGKYGVLAREYLEVRHGYARREQWQRRIEGIEAFAGYLTPLHDAVYDAIYVGDACQIVPALSPGYDLILLIDVIEHLEPVAGRQLLRDCLRIGRNVIVSTPHTFFSQGAAFANPYEVHRSHWRRADLASLGPVCFWPNDHSLIAFLGEDVGRVRQALHQPRRVVRRLFPYLIGPYRALAGAARRLSW